MGFYLLSRIITALASISHRTAVQEQLSRRLIGAIILVSLGVIFIPMILDNAQEYPDLTRSPVPEHPDRHFEPIEIPLDPPPPPPEAASTLIRRMTESDTPPPPAEPPPLPAAPATPPPEPVAAVPPAETAVSPKPVEPSSSAPQVEGDGIPTASDPQGSGWVVQVGSFSNADNAQRLKEKLRGAGFPAFIERRPGEGSTRYKVWVGPVEGRDTADTLRSKLGERMSLSGLVLSYP